MSFPLSRVLVVMGCCVAACAQPAAPPSGTIAGLVLDSGSNAPIRRAVVTLSTVEARPQDAVAWTDASGRFAFGYLPPGRYELRRVGRPTRFNLRPARCVAISFSAYSW